MTKIIVALVVLLGLGVGAWKGAQYLGYLDASPLSTVSTPFSNSSATSNSSSEPVAWKVEEFARDLFVPWSIVFTSPERMLVTERNGSIRVIQEGQVQAQPLHRFSDVSIGGEEGLMGLAIDPNYSQNRFLYVSYAYDQGSEIEVRIVRFTDNGSSLSNPVVLLDGIPAASNHAGNRLRFGPDGKLYSTTGDATDKQLAQNKESLAGKILRLNPDGSIPGDNPFPNSYVYSFGHRNPQGLDWQPETNNLFETEHGPSVFDGPAGGDEVNLIKAGANYGWPTVSHNNSRPGLVSPLLVYTPAEAPASGVFYTGKEFPQFQGNFFFGALRGEGMIRLVFDPSKPEVVASQEKLFDGEYGRIRDIAQGPDGALYFSTSNRDGRGKVRDGDDKIYRIVVE